MTFQQHLIKERKQQSQAVMYLVSPRPRGSGANPSAEGPLIRKSLWICVCKRSHSQSANISQFINQFISANAAHVKRENGQPEEISEEKKLYINIIAIQNIKKNTHTHTSTIHTFTYIITQEYTEFYIVSTRFSMLL